MYGGGQEYGNMIEASLIPGSTISPSPTVMQQQELYHNGNILSANVSSLRTHSSKFPVSRLYFFIYK